MLFMPDSNRIIEKEVVHQVYAIIVLGRAKVSNQGIGEIPTALTNALIRPKSYSYNQAQIKLTTNPEIT